MRSDVIRSISNLSVRNTGGTGSKTASFDFLSFHSSMLPPWWSESRDKQLREFWKKSDHLSGAMYAMQSKMVTIPFHIEARDMTIKSHVEQAKTVTRFLMEGAEFGAGWSSFFTPVVEDLLGQDNGRFIEIVGRGRKNGPIEGAPITVTHLDARSCQRTGDPMFPVIYTDNKGRRHKMHYTRIIFDSQMSSAKEDMLGVGFCAISRAAHNAQTLIDIATYETEKMGSRPFKGVLLAGGGLDPEAVGKTFEKVRSKMDSAGFTRFSQTPVIGAPEIEVPTLEFVSLSDVPDNFDKQQYTVISMAGIALAFGVDARELWPSSETGATRADALLSHIKTQGKGPGHILETTERLFNAKYLPGHLKLIFDYQDDTQDRMRAEIKQISSRTRERNISSSVTTERIERQVMLEDGEIDKAQFDLLELESGRLSDGKSVLTLFYSEDPLIKEMLSMGITDPTVPHKNDAEKMIEKINEQRAVIYKEIADVDIAGLESAGRQSLAALDMLEEIYEETLLIEKEEEAQEEAKRAQQDRDRFGDNNPKVSESTGASSSEVSVSEDMDMDTDDKKEKSKMRKGKGGQIIIDLPTPEVTVEPHITVNVPEQKAPVVNIEQSPVVVNVPKQETPIVNIPKQEAPRVTVNVPKQKAPTVNVNVPKSAPLELPEYEEMELIRDRRGDVSKVIKKRGKSK